MGEYLSDIELLRNKMESLERRADKFHKRMNEKDPVTGASRYGTNTAKRVTSFLERYEALGIGMEMIETGNNDNSNSSNSSNNSNSSNDKQHQKASSKPYKSSKNPKTNTIIKKKYSLKGKRLPNKLKLMKMHYNHPKFKSFKKMLKLQNGSVLKMN